MERYVKAGIAGIAGLLILALAVAFMVGPGAPLEETVARSYNTSVYREQGGDKLVVASGGEIEVQSGATFDLQSGATTDFSSGIDLDGGTLTIDADGDTTLVEAADDAISFTPGVATGKLNVLTGNLAVGNGSPGVTLNGEDAYIEGTLEVDGAATLDGAATVASDLTVSAESTGGNAGAKNEISGLPRIKQVALGTMTNGSTETTQYIDATPTGEWAEVDGGANIVVTADASIYHQTTNSLKLSISTVTENEGVDGTIVQDDLTNNESIGFWIYSTVALTSGDFDVTVDDTNGVDQTYTVGAVSADVWTWIELDVSGCDANCDTTDGIQFLATAQGATNLTAVDIYLDGMYKWDSSDEEALSTAILQDGVLSVMAIPTAAAAANTPVMLTEYTDFFVHYESGNDFLVTITDQSANSGVALIAY